jgi:hypothetical protein
VPCMQKREETIPGTSEELVVRYTEKDVVGSLSGRRRRRIVIMRQGRESGWRRRALARSWSRSWSSATQSGRHRPIGETAWAEFVVVPVNLAYIFSLRT